MSRIREGKTDTAQLARMRKKYLKDSVNKLRDLNGKISALEAEVGPYVEKVRQLEKLYNCLGKEQKRYAKLHSLQGVANEKNFRNITDRFELDWM